MRIVSAAIGASLLLKVFAVVEGLFAERNRANRKAKREAEITAHFSRVRNSVDFLEKEAKRYSWRWREITEGVDEERAIHEDFD